MLQWWENYLPLLTDNMKYKFSIIQKVKERDAQPNNSRDKKHIADQCNDKNCQECGRKGLVKKRN